jgi:biotin transport system substrate-specific component
MKTKSLVLCAVCAAITCVLAPISVPIAGTVPVTLATFAVMLSGILLGGRWGALSQIVYLIIGAVGIPVCAGWTPALPKLLGPTGGYLVGYIPLAFICGAVYTLWGRKSRGSKKFAAMLLGMIAGTVVLYAFGTAWYCILNHVSVGYALTLCVIPFLPGDALKIAAVMLLVPQLEKAIAKLPDGTILKNPANAKK